MVKCAWCKTKTRTNYYLLKFNGKIIAHFCCILCLSGWASHEYEEKREAREVKVKQSPLLDFYDHSASPQDLQSDTSTEVIKK